MLFKWKIPLRQTFQLQNDSPTVPLWLDLQTQFWVNFQTDNRKYLHYSENFDKNFDRELDGGKHDIFVVDAALIYESGADTHMDYVIVITALIKTRMERALARETLSREEILKRMDLQWSEEEKIALADFVIHNDGPEKELIKNITDIYKELV